MSSPKSQATKQRGRRGARKPGGDGWSTAAKLAAAYLDGLRARAHRRYEEHLLDCEACWREVSLARRGRELAESIADTAPAGTREKIRVAVASAATEQPAWVARHHRRHLILATAVPDRSRRARRRRRHVVSLAEQHWRRDRTSINPGRRSGQFRADRLPGTVVPAEQAPDLSTLGLDLVGASTGELDSIGVTVFAYRADTGARLNLYRSSRPIPETGEAEHLSDPESAWETELSGVTVICGPRDPHRTAHRLGRPARPTRRHPAQHRLTGSAWPTDPHANEANDEPLIVQ